MSYETDNHPWDRDATLLQEIARAVAFAEVSTEGVLLAYSEMFSSYFEFSSSDKRGVGIAEAFSHVPAFLIFMQKAIRDEEEATERLIYFERERQNMHLLVDIHLISRDDQPRFLILCKWLNDLVALESQMVRNDKLAIVGKISAGVAHEIRNPLTSVRGFTQMLQNQFQREGREREQVFTHLMLVEIDRVNLLVHELLLLSKPTTMTIDTASIDEVIRGVFAFVQSEALLHGAIVEQKLGDTPPVQIDRDMFKQVLLMLVRNALEAMEGTGLLTITTRYDKVERMVRMDVSDTGPGIPNYLIDRIFDAFYTTKESGIGLGLPICQRIVTEFGGEIRVLNKGYGATFSVLLPPVGGN